MGLHDNFQGLNDFLTGCFEILARESDGDSSAVPASVSSKGSFAIFAGEIEPARSGLVALGVLVFPPVLPGFKDSLSSNCCHRMSNLELSLFPAMTRERWPCVTPKSRARRTRSNRFGLFPCERAHFIKGKVTFSILNKQVLFFE